MNAKARRKLEMGQRALDFSRAHPDATAGYAAALARLEERLTRAEQLAAQQRHGILQVRAATARKRELRRSMKLADLNHVAGIGRVAARELPELTQKLALTASAKPYLAFRTAAREMATEAEVSKEVLVRHGLVETVLEHLVQSLDQLDEAIEQAAEGRLAHVGASAELDTVADDVVQLVRAMDGMNRYRFANEPEALAAWVSASSVLATPHPVAPPAPEEGGEIRPAA